MIIRKSPREIDQMAEAGAVVAQTHELLAEHVRPGVTTGDLNALVADTLEDWLSGRAR